MITWEYILLNVFGIVVSYPSVIDDEHCTVSGIWFVLYYVDVDSLGHIGLVQNMLSNTLTVKKGGIGAVVSMTQSHVALW